MNTGHPILVTQFVKYFLKNVHWFFEKFTSHIPIPLMSPPFVSTSPTIKQNKTKTIWSQRPQYRPMAHCNEHLFASKAMWRKEWTVWHSLILQLPWLWTSFLGKIASRDFLDIRCFHNQRSGNGRLQHDSLLRGSGVPGGNVYVGWGEVSEEQRRQKCDWDAKDVNFRPFVLVCPILCCSSSSFSSFLLFAFCFPSRLLPDCPLSHLPHLYPVLFSRSRAAGVNSRATLTEAGFPLPDSIQW